MQNELYVQALIDSLSLTKLSPTSLQPSFYLSGFPLHLLSSSTSQLPKKPTVSCLCFPYICCSFYLSCLPFVPCYSNWVFLEKFLFLLQSFTHASQKLSGSDSIKPTFLCTDSDLLLSYIIVCYKRLFTSLSSKWFWAPNKWRLSLIFVCISPYPVWHWET